MFLVYLGRIHEHSRGVRVGFEEGQHGHLHHIVNRLEIRVQREIYLPGI